MDELIRSATLDDLEDIQSLNLKLFEKEHKEYDPLLDLCWTFWKEGTMYYKNRILEDDGCVVVALLDNKVVGYICGGITKAESYRNLPIVAELENTFVLETFRSQGIGSRLFEKFIERCRNKNVGKIRVIASAQNEGAIKFYRANKFNDYALTLEMDM